MDDVIANIVTHSHNKVGGSDEMKARDMQDDMIQEDFTQKRGELQSMLIRKLANECFGKCINLKNVKPRREGELIDQSTLEI